MDDGVAGLRHGCEGGWSEVGWTGMWAVGGKRRGASTCGMQYRWVRDGQRWKRV